MRTLACLTLLTLLGACTGSRMHVPSPTSGDVLRRELETAEGPETWRLKSSSWGEPRVQRTATKLANVARLGVDVKDLGREFAEARGLKVGQGVVVTRVAEDSPAAAAGLVVHDVLRALDGEPLVSQSQLTDLVRTSLSPGVPALLRRQSLIEAEGGWVLDEDTLTIVPDASTYDTTTSTAWDLQVGEAVRELTGLEAVLLTADVAASLLDSDSPTVVVTAVTPGSPAYLAGLRAGDHITTLDGQPLTDLEPLTRAVLGHALHRGHRLPASARHLTGVVAHAERPRLEVDGPLGVHATTLGVSADLDDDSSFTFPWIFSWKSDIQQSTWGFLYPLGFQIGPQYDAAYVQSETRDTERLMNVSFLPLRLLDYRRRVDHEEIRFLWLIHWDL